MDGDRNDARLTAGPVKGALTDGKTAGRKCSGGANAGSGAAGWAVGCNITGKNNDAANVAGNDVIAGAGPEALFIRLAAIMEEQRDLVDALTKAGRRQTEALRTNDLTVFNETVRLQESLSGELAAREEERLKLLAGMPKAPGQEKERLNLNAARQKAPGREEGSRLTLLAVRAPEPLREKLLSLRAQLQAGMRELQQVTETNRYIIHWCWDFNDRLIKIIGAARGGVYGADGGVNAGRPASGLDCSV